MAMASVSVLPIPGKVVADATVIARCRAMLGPEAEGLSDQDVEHIRRHADTMARLIVEMFTKASR